MKDTSRLKVLVSAFTCEADEGSEPEVGWRWGHEMAREVDVIVLTQGKNRERIEKWYADYPDHFPKVRFAYFDLNEIWSKYKKKWGWVLLPYYIFWQWAVTRKVDQLLGSERIDIIHHVTFASFRYPVFLKGKPIVWGPVGGADTAPLSLISSGGGILGMGRELFRNIVTFLSANMVGRINPIGSNGGEVYASTIRTQRVFSKAGINSELMPTIGVDITDEVAPQRKPPKKGTLHLLFVGRLHHLKGIHLLLEALSQIEDGSVKLSIVGEGEQRKRLIKQVGKLNLGERVEFIGALPRKKLDLWYQKADVLVAPSLYESGGLTVLEGFRWALPAIVLDCGGHAMSVAEGCGIRVNPQRRKSDVVVGIADAIRNYLIDPERVVKDGKRGWKRLKTEYSWKAKREKMITSYKRLAGDCESDES